MKKIRYVLERAPQGDGWVALDTETGYTYPRNLYGHTEVTEAMDLVKEMNDAMPEIPVPTIEQEAASVDVG